MSRTSPLPLPAHPSARVASPHTHLPSYSYASACMCPHIFPLPYASVWHALTRTPPNLPWRVSHKAALRLGIINDCQRWNLSIEGEVISVEWLKGDKESCCVPV